VGWCEEGVIVQPSFKIRGIIVNWFSVAEKSIPDLLYRIIEAVCVGGYAMTKLRHAAARLKPIEAP